MAVDITGEYLPVHKQKLPVYAYLFFVQFRWLEEILYNTGTLSIKVYSFNTGTSRYNQSGYTQTHDARNLSTKTALYVPSVIVRTRQYLQVGLIATDNL